MVASVVKNLHPKGGTSYRVKTKKTHSLPVWYDTKTAVFVAFFIKKHPKSIKKSKSKKWI
jgi:hypothetical protein